MSFSSACCLAHWSVLPQLGYFLSAGIFMIGKGFTILLMENLYLAIMLWREERMFYDTVKCFVKACFRVTWLWEIKGTQQIFVWATKEGLHPLSLFSLFSTLNLWVDKNSSWSSGHSLICISEVGRCPALGSVLPTSFFWELWEVPEQLTGKREADVPWSISWSLKDRTVSRLLSLLGNASIATSLSQPVWA